MQFLVEEIEVAEPELPESFAETEIEIPPQHDDEPVDSENQYYLKWNDNYKTAYEMIHDKRRNCRIICKRNCFCCRRLSQEMLLLCLNWESCMRLKSWAKKDAEKSFEFYRKALQGFLKSSQLQKKIEAVPAI